MFSGLEIRGRLLVMVALRLCHECGICLYSYNPFDYTLLDPAFRTQVKKDTRRGIDKCRETTNETKQKSDKNDHCYCVAVRILLVAMEY